MVPRLFRKIITTEVMPCKPALARISQVSNFFVIDLNHRITMLKINVSNLKTQLGYLDIALMQLYFLLFAQFPSGIAE